MPSRGEAVELPVLLALSTAAVLQATKPNYQFFRLEAAAGVLAPADRNTGQRLLA